MDANELYGRLEVYGADIKGINSRFFDERDFFAECFRDFLDDPAFSELDRAAAEKNHSAAFNAAHALKGTSANLGLTPFYNAVCELVEALRDEQYDKTDALYDKVKRAYARMKKIAE